MKKILVVDDNDKLRELMKEILEMWGGYEVYTSENGINALRIIDRQNFDLIISDIEMPRVNGFQLIEAIRKREISTPIILISALPEYRKIAERISVGFLLKPFSPKELKSMIEGCL